MMPCSSRKVASSGQTRAFVAMDRGNRHNGSIRPTLLGLLRRLAANVIITRLRDTIIISSNRQNKTGPMNPDHP